MPILSTRIHDALSARLTKLAEASRKPVSSVTKEAIGIGLAQLEVRQRSDPAHTLAALSNAMSLGTEPPYWAWSTMAGYVYEAFRQASSEFVTSGTVQALGRFLLAGYRALPKEEDRTFYEPELLSTLNAVDRYNAGKNHDVPRAIEALIRTSGDFSPIFVARAIADCLPAIFSEDQVSITAPSVNAAAAPFFQDIYPMAVYGLRRTTPPSEIHGVLPGENEMFADNALVPPVTIRLEGVEISAVGWRVPAIECYVWTPSPARARIRVAYPFALCGGIEHALHGMGGSGHVSCGGGLRITRSQVGREGRIYLEAEGIALEMDEPSLRQVHGALFKLLRSEAFIANFRRWRSFAGTLMVPL